MDAYLVVSNLARRFLLSLLLCALARQDLTLVGRFRSAGIRVSVLRWEFGSFRFQQQVFLSLWKLLEYNVQSLACLMPVAK